MDLNQSIAVILLVIFMQTKYKIHQTLNLANFHQNLWFSSKYCITFYGDSIAKCPDKNTDLLLSFLF